MNIRDLEYIIAVAEEGHFGKAAEKCFVSQPTLSMQIKKLEKELGAQIFERNNKQVLITPPGQEIIRQAREILLAKDNLLDLTKQINDPLGGIFRLGIIPTLGPYLLPHILPILKVTFRSLILTIVENKTEELTLMLQQGKLDAIIASMPIDLSHFMMSSLFKEPFYAVLNARDPLCKKPTLCLEDLPEKNILLLEEGHCLRDQILNVCKRETPQNQNYNFSLTSLETLYYIIAAEGGVSLFPSLAIQARAENPHIVICPFTPPAPSREIALFWRKGSYRNLCCTRIGESIAHWASTKKL